MGYWSSVLLVFLGSCSYGVLSTFVKLAYQAGFLPGEVSGSQMFFAMVFMWGVALLFSRRKVRGKQWLTLAGTGLATGLTGILYYQSLQYVPASIAIVLLFQFTWIGVIIESFIERRRPGVEKVAALVLLATGTLLAGGVLAGEFGSLHPVGILFGLLSAVTYALFIIFSGRVGHEISPYTRSAVMLTGSVLITFIVYPPSFLLNGALTEGLLVYALPLALFGGVIPTLFFTLGVPHVGGGLATILSAAELPMAVFMSSVVLHEKVSLLQWLGVVIILVGIAVPELSHKHRTAAVRDRG
ncbi:EamA family transporter [Aneurinibacillus danicus]|uniref:Multidrug transporter n=1 Tax=Aneurinibacillus danicus TaxID=267746 RepID=A0A511V828_9BACL|nr:EamA family transporter [Aneurinibacillus danicus]GEN34979.1 multidrug transporter [Aneurinibacillus danicus]